MGQITRTTNPTGLKQIDKKLFVVRVIDDASEGRVFWLDHFDYAAAKLAPTVNISCIAHAGSTEEYFDLGALGGYNKSPMNIRALATNKPLKFRFIFNNPGESLLIGYADGVKVVDETGSLGTSLVDIEPIDLDGIPWLLVLPDGTASGDKPNILVERSLFPTASVAVNHPWFGVLVMPEVMRQIAMAIAKDPSALNNTESWIAQWKDFLGVMGVILPSEKMEESNSEQEEWANHVVTKFTAKGIFKHHIAKALAELEGDKS